MYRKRDVESVVRIKKLLYEDGFTIAGARVQLREETKSERNQTRASVSHEACRERGALAA